ncbi:BTB/POZ domain-containing protein 3-like [Ruditapes philippinarum]|uniref:BTB/POZ domain-containing protein 3-like n=1 Tax=Ruditapes philippinarum TaxID=129788 RepID=UPI00295ACC68|nr:BTB/POZ domain-containing protein 3-like [Ruditapes philippinarum]
MQSAFRMATKSCVPKFRSDSDEEVNQEVPSNYAGNQTAQKPIQRAPRSMTDPVWKTPRNPPAPPQISLPTSQASREYNWQGNMTSVREKNSVMYNNPLMADVYFTVGSGNNKQRIAAHKYVLATGSSVFYAMFYGGLADQKDDIDLPDVEPVAFQNLLRYLYCDEINLAADNVLSTLYVAKKYIVPFLARACVQYLETSLSARNACILLCQGRLFEEQELMEQCWEVIDAQAEEALASDGFVDIDFSTLESVLLRETLNAREVTVFNAACRWAEAQCRRREVEPSAENKRKVLGESFNLIRIPSMSLEEFANGPAQSGILSHKETTDIFLYFTANNKPELPFKRKSRSGLLPQKCHRFQSSAYRSNQWRYRGRCDSIQFAVDRRVFIAGFGLYGSSNGAMEYQVKVELKKDGIILGQSFLRFFSDGSSNTFPVMFDNPIQVEPETFYTASAILDGPELSYFGQEGMAEIQCGKVTFQFQCSSDSTNGTGVQGGQIPEIIFYS